MSALVMMSSYYRYHVCYLLLLRCCVLYEFKNYTNLPYPI